MASNGDNGPDLTAILKTLSAFAPPANAVNSSFSHDTNPSPHRPNGPEEDEYEPSDMIPSQPFQSQQTARHPAASYTPAPAMSSNISAIRSGANTPDASTIVSWTAALRYVMRAVSQNEALQSKIRRLIRSQHEHEKQWWQGREALLAKQKARVEKKKKLDEVLRSVGAPVDESKEVSTAEEDRAELHNYDSKVYKASTEMAKALDSELRALGIPFFAVKHALVSSAPPDEAEKVRTESPDPRTDSERSEALSREELFALQRRMLELLQDLCKE